MRRAGLVLLLCFVPVPVFASAGAWDVRAGNNSFRQGHFAEARTRYEAAARKDPAAAGIAYDIGAAAYKAGDFDGAVAHFQQGLLTDDDHFRRDVHYNLGNALYRSGTAREDKDIAGAMERLQGAVGSFEKALVIDPGDQDAAHNRDFVRQELERLRKKQEEQRQQQQSQQQNKDQQGKDQPPKDTQDKGSAQKGSSSQDRQERGTSGQDQPQASPQEKPGDEQAGAKPQPQPTGEKDTPSGQTDGRQISSQKDANDLVDDFERNELPKGLLNFIREPRAPRPVEKDW